MTSLFPERIDIENTESSVPITEALHLKKQYLYKNARLASNAKNEWEKKSVSNQHPKASFGRKD